jgi:hypothetical protein
VHVPDALERCIAASSDETAPLADAPIAACARKQRLMCSFMDQIGGQYHAVRAKHDAYDVQDSRMRTHECK